MLSFLSILIGFLAVQDNSLDLQLKKILDSQLSGYVKYEYQIVQVPKNYSRIEINSEKKTRLTKNYLYVPIKLYDSKKSESLSILTLRVKLFKNVLFAEQDITRNQNLSNNFFSVKLTDVAMNEERIVNSDFDVTQMRSKVLIKSGTMLTLDMIEPVPVIYKGDKIKLHTGRTGVDVSVDVIARQDGCVGDVISVYSGGTKIYKGKIIDKNTITLVE